MKKFDHLTSLDAIDPLPCKLGAKVESGKPEETSFHMGHKLKPGFSVKDGKLKYAPPTPTVKPKRFEFIEIPANVQRGVRGGVTIGEIKELNRDFDGDAITIPELNAVFDPQIQPSLNSPTPVVSRKLNNSGVSGAFLRKTPLFDLDIVIEFSNLKDRDEARAESGAVTPKQDAASEQLEIDAVVRHLLDIDQAIRRGMMSVDAGCRDLLRYPQKLLVECLSRKEVIDLSWRGARALAKRFHTKPADGFNAETYALATKALLRAILEIRMFGPSRLIKLLQGITLRSITNPALFALVPSSLREMPSFELEKILNDASSSDIPETYMAIMRQELNDRIKRADVVSQLTRLKLSSAISRDKNRQ